MMAQTFLSSDAYAPAAPSERAAPRPLESPPALRLPLLYKVLVANVSIVVLGAICGTWLTIVVTRSASEMTGIPLAAVFAAAGVVLSVVVNLLVLRAAFRPLVALERVAEAVRAGDLTARAAPLPPGDPEVSHLAMVFNQTLDQLERDQAQLRSVASQVIAAQEEERKRVSRELHDDTAQVLFAQLLRVTALKGSDHPEVQRLSEQLEQMTADALEGVRRLALELRPPALDDLGLPAALADLAQRFGEQLDIPVELEARGLRGRLPEEVELVLYRVAQEALTNAAKHALASRIAIDLERTARDVTLSVQDDGRGFDAGVTTRPGGRGLGLFGMAERVALVGGRFAIWTRLGAGTEIFAFIPLTTNEEPAPGERRP
ncbi:MAG TPA: ATP-binding protein [Thermomicrobiales bacterium]|nr:ATP-binding protein [Thermomicrobiales bacterium]